jgi:signal transduction histidine kinase
VTSAPASELSLSERREPTTLDEALRSGSQLPRWIGWRLRLLVGLILTACVLVFMLAQWLTTQPRLPLGLRGSPEGVIKLVASTTPALQRLEGHGLEGIQVEKLGPLGEVSVLVAPLNLLALQRSGRWIPEDHDYQAYLALHQGLSRVMDALPREGGTLVLQLIDVPDEPVLVAPRGWSGLSPLYWMLSALAVVVMGVGAVVLLAGPQWRNVAFAVLTLTQSGHLLLMATESTLDVLMPVWFIELDTHLRTAFDVIAGAAMIQVAVLHPRRFSAWPWASAGGWLAALGLGLGAALLPPTWRWWWIQSGCTLLVLTAIGFISLTYQQSPHPFALVLRRFTSITLATWVLLSLAVAASGNRPDMLLNVTTFGVMTWHVFFASQLLLSPYLSRSRQILQEFSLLAASSTVAASLDLIFVAVFSLGQFTSMTLSLFLSFGVYLSIRRWVMTNLLSRDPITTERLFERLYRIARELERHPSRLDDLMNRLMRELFDPLECTLVKGDVAVCDLRGNGGILLVPLPALAQADQPASKAFVLKHADKGRRLFTSEDARLAERIVEQLHRVLSFDRAVEQGRSEERLRIAQDLHDDIGARLLTLMYQAPNPEIEDYIRHTLQDLKTLTRGLAVASHTLLDAASEWKRDLSHRLNAARCELDWSLTCEHDLELTVVQWSALTRILRELVNNTISHAKANRVRISLSLDQDRLELVVTDNGVGRAPETWSHGLGLGGVRKRVKQLGGSVVWREVDPVGIECRVVVDPFSAPHQG